jgi:CDP-glucose 4,6-dehydratase
MIPMTGTREQNGARGVRSAPNDLRSDLAWYRGRSVLITGHTGFKGSWLSLWLHELGAQVSGYALDPPTTPSNFVVSQVGDILAVDHRADIRDRSRLESAIEQSKPEVVLHLAAQSVVLTGYADPTETFSVNIIGTTVLLDAVRAIGRPCAVVVVTSDKCYANDESGRRFVEDDPLGGDDPYSASKAGTELVAAAYRDSFFPPAVMDRHGIAVATARAGNVIGGGDWTAHGVVADIMRALANGESVGLRRPAAIRPWQHVLEPLAGYLLLARRLRDGDRATFSRSWNFGPRPEDEASVQELTELLLEAWGGGSWHADEQTENPPEAGILRLAIDRAVQELGWRPRWRLAEAVRRTAGWFREYTADPGRARAACVADIDAYVGEGTDGV